MRRFRRPVLNATGIDEASPGALSEAADAGVVLRVAVAIRDIPGISRMRPAGSRGHRSVWLDVSSGMQRVSNKVTTAVQAVATFPAAEVPAVCKPTTCNRDIAIAVSGNADIAASRSIAERQGKGLLALSEFGHVDMSGGQPHGMSMKESDVARCADQPASDGMSDADRRCLMEFPGSTMSNEQGDIAAGGIAAGGTGCAESERIPCLDRLPAVTQYVSRAVFRRLIERMPRCFPGSGGRRPESPDCRAPFLERLAFGASVASAAPAGSRSPIP